AARSGASRSREAGIRSGSGAAQGAARGSLHRYLVVCALSESLRRRRRGRLARAGRLRGENVDQHRRPDDQGGQSGPGEPAVAESVLRAEQASVGDAAMRACIAILLCLVVAAPITAQRRATGRPAPAAATASPAGIDSASYAQLKFRHIGPEGNRVSSVAGVPSDPSIYYAGAASGGLWKSSDGGVRWEPIFDDQPV